MKIPGILTDVTTKGVVVETSQIKDIPQNKTLEQINADIEDVEGDIIELQLSVQNHGARLNTAETKISTLETNVNNLDEWLDDVASDVSDHTTRLGAAESNITTLLRNVGSISSDVVEIKRKIPAAATASNQLADKDFVNSSIATATATFRGAYRLYDDLGLRVTGNTYDKPSCAFTLKTVISSEDNNDYCFVLIPIENTAGAATQYIDRYKYNGTDWSYEYTLNNSGFTAEQWAAINSGINANIIPITASVNNKLADKEYVREQIKAPVTKRTINVTLNQLGVYDSNIDLSNETTLACLHYCPVLEVHVSGIINEVFLVPIYYLNTISVCGGEAVVNKYRLRVIQIINSSSGKSRFILERLVDDLPYTEKIKADGIIETVYWELTDTTKPYRTDISNSTLYNYIKKWGLTSLKVNSVINRNNYGASTKPIQTLSGVDGYFVGDFVGEAIPTTRAVSGFYMIVTPTNIQVQLDDRLTGLTGNAISTVLHPTGDELIHKLDAKYFDAVKTADLAGYGTDVAPNGELHFGDEFDLGTSNGQANSVILKTPFTSSEKTKLSDLPTNATLETRLQTIEGSAVFEAGTGTNSAKTKNSGAYVIASGAGSFTNGRGDSNNTIEASGSYSHAEGYGTKASGDYSHAEGQSAGARNIGAHAEGKSTTASGQHSHAEGGDTSAIAQYSHAEGSSTRAGGFGSHAEGESTETRSSDSHAEGYGSKTLEGSDYSHAEGCGSFTSALYSHAEGRGSHTFGNNSHAEGRGTTTFGSQSHSEGEGTGFMRLGQIINNPADFTNFVLDNPVQVYKGDIVSNDADFRYKRAIVTEDSYGVVVHVDHHKYSQADTIYIARGISSGTGSHSEGKDTKASGDYSHAEGNLTYTEGQYSHAEGMYTQATNTGEHAAGKYNKSNQGTIHSVGVGTSVDDRKNAWEIDESGNVYIKDIGGYDGTNPSADVSIQNFCSNIILDGYTIDDTISTPYHGTVTIKKDNQPVSGADLYNTLKSYWDKGKVPVLKILLSSATASYNLPMYYQPIGEMASHLVFSNDVVIGLRVSSTGVANLVLNSVTNLFT